MFKDWLLLLFASSAVASSRERRSSRPDSPERSQPPTGQTSSDDANWEPNGDEDHGPPQKFSMSLRRRSSNPPVPYVDEFSPSSYMMGMAPGMVPAATYYTYMPVQQNHHHHPQVQSTGAKIQSFFEKAIRIGILVLGAYVLFLSWTAIEKDMADRIAIEQKNLGGQISLCAANYKSNNCDNPVELTKQQCQEWQTCMSGSPSSTGTRVEAFVFALGSVFQKFLAAFTWETKFFLLFAGIMILNVFKSSFAWLLSGNGGTVNQAPPQYAPQPLV